MIKRKLVTGFAGLGISILVITAVVYRLKQTESDYTPIPVTFSSASIPLMEVKIEGKTYPFSLDLGSKFALTLGKDLLSGLTKTACGSETWQDLTGRAYESPLYCLPKVEIGGIELIEPVAQEECDEVAQYVSTTKSGKPHRPEAIGRPLLEKHNLLLNFPQSELIACNNLKKLKKAGFAIETWTRVPFEIKGGVMLLSINTDLGQLVFWLDTGATTSIINPALTEEQKCVKGDYGLDTFTTSMFAIQEKEFGPMALYLWEFGSSNADGVLGMDFLETHPVYIDYNNRQLYIGERAS